MADNLVIDLTLESEAEDQVSAFSSGFYSKLFLQKINLEIPQNTNMEWGEKRQNC